jgi:uncharacterized protein
VTPEALRQVEQAERFLKEEIGLRQVRVRHHGPIARIEVEPDDLLLLAQPAPREQIVARLRACGYTYVTLDLAGFRSGSMNALLDRPASRPAIDDVVWLAQE